MSLTKKLIKDKDEDKEEDKDIAKVRLLLLL